MTDAKRLLADSRRALWRECVETHAQEDWGTTCDACLYLPEVYAQLEAVEAHLPDYLAAVEALELLVATSRVTDQEDDTCGVCYGQLDEHSFGCEAHGARAALARLREKVPA